MNPQLPLGEPELTPAPPALQPLRPADAVIVPEPVAGPLPWERRQPQMRRPVLPVEFFRRMPGGGTTYAPLGADPTDT